MRRYIRKSAVGCICHFLAAFLLIWSGTTHADVIYFTGNRDPLISFDTESGMQTIIGRTGAVHVESLAFSRTGKLYGIDNDDNTVTGGVVTFDLTTGAATRLAGFFAGPRALEFDLSGRLFALSGLLWEIDPATSSIISTSTVSGLGNSIVESLAVTPVAIRTGQATYAAGTFFAATSTSELYAFNLHTLTASLIDSSIIASQAIAFGSGGALYLTTTDGEIYSYDFGTQTETLLGALSAPGLFIQGAAVLRVSEPKTLTLLLAGLVVLGFVVRQRFRV